MYEWVVTEPSDFMPDLAPIQDGVVIISMVKIVDIRVAIHRYWREFIVRV